MFKIEANPTFSARVSIGVPGGPTADLNCVFRHKTQEQYREFFSEAAVTGRTDAQAIFEIVDSWDADAPLTVDNVARLISNHHGAAWAILDTYARELTQARRGN
jgi:hypothetical protein